MRRAMKGTKIQQGQASANGAETAALNSHGKENGHATASPAATAASAAPAKIPDTNESETLRKVALLRNVPEIFDEVPDEQMSDLANAMTWATAPMGEAIVSEGEPGDAMYIVANGTLEAQMSDVGTVKEYIEGGYFGEQVRQCPLCQPPTHARRF